MKSMFERCVEGIFRRNTQNVARINMLTVALENNGAISTKEDLEKLRSIKNELRAEYKKCLEELDELTDVCGIYEVELGGFKLFGKEGGE